MQGEEENHTRSTRACNKNRRRERANTPFQRVSSSRDDAGVLLSFCSCFHSPSQVSLIGVDLLGPSRISLAEPRSRLWLPSLVFKVPCFTSNEREPHRNHPLAVTRTAAFLLLLRHHHHHHLHLLLLSPALARYRPLLTLWAIASLPPRSLFAAVAQPLVCSSASRHPVERYTQRGGCSIPSPSAHYPETLASSIYTLPANAAEPFAPFGHQIDLYPGLRQHKLQ